MWFQFAHLRSNVRIDKVAYQSSTKGSRHLPVPRLGRGMSKRGPSPNSTSFQVNCFSFFSLRHSSTGTTIAVSMPRRVTISRNRNPATGVPPILPGEFPRNHRQRRAAGPEIRVLLVQTFQQRCTRCGNPVHLVLLPLVQMEILCHCRAIGAIVLNMAHEAPPVRGKDRVHSLQSDSYLRTFFQPAMADIRRE